jgi:restriction system protein
MLSGIPLLMARRKQSLFVDLLDFAAMLPWWLSFILAVVIYLVLNGMSLESGAANQAAVSTPGNVTSVVFTGVFPLVIGVFKYALPAAFVVGGVVSLIRQTGRSNLYDYASQGEDRSVLETMTWRQFEVLVSEAFRRQGYSVQETEDGPDGGVDLVISKEGETYLVQCKQWKTSKIGVPKIRELYGVVASQGVAGGIFVASGDYTQEATTFAKANRIRLIDGNELHAMIRNVQQDKPSPAVTVLDGVKCPVCNSAMVERMARQGVNAGNKFWGCSQYPKCRGTRDF